MSVAAKTEFKASSSSSSSSSPEITEKIAAFIVHSEKHKRTALQIAQALSLERAVVNRHLYHDGVFEFQKQLCYFEEQGKEGAKPLWTVASKEKKMLEPKEAKDGTAKESKTIVCVDMGNVEGILQEIQPYLVDPQLIVIAYCDRQYNGPDLKYVDARIRFEHCQSGLRSFADVALICDVSMLIHKELSENKCTVRVVLVSRDHIFEAFQEHLKKLGISTHLCNNWTDVKMHIE